MRRVTGSRRRELGALLLEAELQRQLRPTANRVAESGECFALRLIANRACPIYERVPIAGTDPLG